MNINIPDELSLRMTSRKLRKSPGAGFGQYPDSVFKEQVGFKQDLSAVY